MTTCVNLKPCYHGFCWLAVVMAGWMVALAPVTAAASTVYHAENPFKPSLPLDSWPRPKPVAAPKQSEAGLFGYAVDPMNEKPRPIM